MAEIVELETLATSIPEMGGRRIGGFLRQLAANAPANTAIVELGCWLGAGTAQLAMGLNGRLAGHGVTIEAFDHFVMSASSSAKASAQGVQIREGQDMLPWVTNALRPFGPNINLHKGMIDELPTWRGKPISVYVDDASIYPHAFYRSLRTFGPSWIPGTTTIVLMDFWLFQKPRGRTQRQLENLRCQFDFMEEYADCFERVHELVDGTGAAFRYVHPLDFDDLPLPPRPPVRERTVRRPWYQLINPFGRSSRPSREQ